MQLGRVILLSCFLYVSGGFAQTTRVYQDVTNWVSNRAFYSKIYKYNFSKWDDCKEILISEGIDEKSAFFAWHKVADMNIIWDGKSKNKLFATTLLNMDSKYFLGFDSIWFFPLDDVLHFVNISKRIYIVDDIVGRGVIHAVDARGVDSIVGTLEKIESKSTWIVVKNKKNETDFVFRLGSAMMQRRKVFDTLSKYFADDGFKLWGIQQGFTEAFYVYLSLDSDFNPDSARGAIKNFKIINSFADMQKEEMWEAPKATDPKSISK